jgi:phosphoglycerate dehydrogenase-like enzyme
MTIRVAVSGIPRGYQFPRPDGNWLQEKHLRRILETSPDIELIEVPADRVKGDEEAEVVLAEGGNRTHYPGELDWEDYQRYFTPSLRWVQLCSTGFSDNVTPEIIDGRVALTNAPGLHTVPIAESVVAAMLDHAKNLKQRREDQEAHRWAQLKNDELHGRTVLLIGLGNIGKRVARLCKAFEMTVIGTKRRVETVPSVDRVFPTKKLRDNLGEADYVVVAAPLTPETENMLGDADFKAMKPSAYLVNVGRGRIAHEPSLLRALRESWIAGAYLDVFEAEPLPADHPFWDMENVFVVPHDSHSSPYIGDRVVDIFCDNLRRYVDGEPLRHVCDPKRGY